MLVGLIVMVRVFVVVGFVYPGFMCMFMNAAVSMMVMLVGMLEGVSMAVVVMVPMAVFLVTVFM